MVTVYLSPVWVLAQCWLLTLAFSLWVTVPTSTLSWLSVPRYWPTKIYICPSLSLMLPFNIGLPKTPPGLILDRCHEPCPSVIPNTDQPRPNWSPSLDPMLPQHQSNQDSWVLTLCYLNTSPIQDYCFLESVIRVKPKQLHQMAVSTNASFRWACHLLVPHLSDTENYWGLQGYSPFQDFTLLFCFFVTFENSYRHLNQISVFSFYLICHFWKFLQITWPDECLYFPDYLLVRIWNVHVFRKTK